MKLKIHNLGPIKKGEIDLDKKVYVFVGYNNSGKTYVSQLLWALFQYKPYTLHKAPHKVKKSGPIQVKITARKIVELMSEVVKNINKDYLANLFNIDKEHFLLKDFRLDISYDIDERISYIKNQAIRIGRVSTNNLFSDKSLKRTAYYFIKEKGSLDIQISSEEMRLDKLVSSFFDPKAGGIQSISIVQEENVSTVINDGINEIYSLLLRINQSDSFFIPANRAFYPSFYRYIYSSTKENQQKINELISKENVDRETSSLIKSLSKQNYTSAMNQCIEHLFRLRGNEQVNQSNTELLTELKLLMGGEIINPTNDGVAPVDFKLNTPQGEIDM